MAGSLRKALEAGDPEERVEQLTRAALGDDLSSRIVAGFRAWRAADGRARGARPGSPEAERLHQEALRLWAAYESAVNDADGG